MSNVIDLLERLGADAQLRHASDAELAQALVEAQIDPAVREALLLRDQRRLEALLGANANVCCMIATPAQEEREQSETERIPEDADESGDEPVARLEAG